ncbi:hypothetical protein MNEG_12956 [Monoraphidium neglectum]|uniref:Uncharacterized protein n=1 Tax=Monoraphidium neglectum TaxID=145388 RepID=A0A0D2MJ28_9CHLO|nr:hypothetical protein MNEG_12956 [Monoraphidium neglectum]KIY95005.1 hypothetical protein MNEG_12956 [Monoraphidium neglectum]|eukprot:XP_013894025.1 hypothetical protein MNEG_12956 [Monoraphidium neglectum]
MRTCRWGSGASVAADHKRRHRLDARWVRREGDDYPSVQAALQDDSVRVYSGAAAAAAAGDLFCDHILVWDILALPPDAADAPAPAMRTSSGGGGGAGAHAGSSASGAAPAPAPAAHPALHEALVRIAASKRQGLSALELTPLEPHGPALPAGDGDDDGSFDHADEATPAYYSAMAPEDGPRAAAAGGGRGGDAGWAEDEDGEGGGAAPHFEIKQRRTAGPGAASGARRRYHCAPASGRGALGLLRRYELGAVLAKAVVRGLGTADLNFPIKICSAERSVVTFAPRPPAPLLVIGRSGTGEPARATTPGPQGLRPRARKTTCLVLRMFEQWRDAREASAADPSLAPPRQLFVTASSTLKNQVRRSFRRLQAAELSAAERQEQAVALAALHGGGGGGSGEGGDGAPDSLLGVPDAAWPLFLTGSQLLRLLDAALPGSFLRPEDSFDGDEGRIKDLQQKLEQLEEAEEEEEEAEAEAERRAAALSSSKGGKKDVSIAAAAGKSGVVRSGSGGGGSGRGAKRKEVAARRMLTHSEFLARWQSMAQAAGIDRDRVDGALVFQEIMTHLKGSAEAVCSASGCLDLEAYLALGGKRASTFSRDLRVVVHRILEPYTAMMREHRR